jgi:hypothetical protein
VIRLRQIVPVIPKGRTIPLGPLCK